MQGVGKSCLYCGDGINDLAALAAADVGMAVGAAEASAAATFSDKHYSVAGAHLHIKLLLLFMSKFAVAPMLLQNVSGLMH